MASSMIHIAIASELNKKLKRDRYGLLIGTIAPDISKHVGRSKYESHFLNSLDDEVPNLDKFLEKYKDKLSDDFVLGYYIHLFVDYLWFKYFIPEIYDEDNSLIKKLDGTVVKCNGRMALQYIYNDYTNLNVRLIDDYELDLKIFYNDIPNFDNIIEEIPMDKLYLIVDKAIEIVMNSKLHKDMVFNMDNIHQFISLCIELVESNLRDLGVL